MAEFVKAYDARKDRLWIAVAASQIVGSIAIAGHAEQATRLRWFLVHPKARGKGLGRKLLGESVEFCRSRGFRSIFLWTISELKAAANLYREAGFGMTERKTHEIRGSVRAEERYDRVLK